MSTGPDTAIAVDDVSKQFRIPHEKHATLKAAALNVFSRKKYTELQALKDVNFEVRKGEFFGIIGRNGCGKSTLLKIIAGIYVPTSGEVRIDGRISPFLELGVGFNPELTARENIYLNGAIMGLSRKEIDECFDEILDFAELEEFVDMKVKNFSSGMHVRLAFSVAIRAHADILLIDEVLAVGDANFQEKCINEFAKFKREERTILFVTHDMGLIEKFCDRALLIDRGKLSQIGKPRKIAYEYNLINALEKGKELAAENMDQGGSREVNRWGDGFAKVEQIWMEDENRDQKNVFDQELTKICIKAKIKFYNEAENPIFGIIIRNADYRDVFGTNTLYDGIETGKFKPGQEIIVEYLLENRLVKGDYSISPAIAYSDAKRYYDWRDNWYKFSISSTKKSAGIVELKHKISIHKSE